MRHPHYLHYLHLLTQLEHNSLAVAAQLLLLVVIMTISVQDVQWLSLAKWASIRSICYSIYLAVQ